MEMDLLSLVLEKVFIYLSKKDITRVHLVWHGGEPLLAGKDFFKKAVRMVGKKWPGVQVLYFLQTNGLLLDWEFGLFFKEMNFNLGLSLDGPGEVHDRLRVDAAGNGTHTRVMETVALLADLNIPVGFNAVISKVSTGQEESIYNFFKSLGAGFRVNPIIPGRDPDIFFGYGLDSGEYGTCLSAFFDLMILT